MPRHLSGSDVKGKGQTMRFKAESLIDAEAESFLSDFTEIVPSGLNGAAVGDAEGIGFPALLQEMLSVFSDNGGAVGSFFTLMIGIVGLMALASLFSGKLSRTAECAVSVICSAAIFSMIYAVTRQATEALSGILRFVSAFIPIITGAVAYGGGVGAAAAGMAGANMTLGIIGAFIIPLMTSCSSMILALGLVSSVGAETGALCAKVKSFFIWLVGLCSVLLLSSIALQSAIASAADTAAMRAAKYAATGAVPIVGSTVSSAMGALVSGASYIKSTLGTGALTVILITSLTPLALLLVYRFIISLGEGVLEFLGVNTGARMLAAIRAAFDALCAVFAITVSVLIIETVLLMKSGVSGV